MTDLTRRTIEALILRAEGRWQRAFAARDNGQDGAYRHHLREYNRTMRAVAYLRQRAA